MDAIVGYDARPKQVEYAKLLSAKWYADHPGKTVSMEEINNLCGEEESVPNMEEGETECYGN